MITSSQTYMYYMKWCACCFMTHIDCVIIVWTIAKHKMALITEVLHLSYMCGRSKFIYLFDVMQLHVNVLPPYYQFNHIFMYSLYLIIYVCIYDICVCLK